MALAAIALLAAACLPAPVPLPKPTEKSAPVATEMPITANALPIIAPTAEATVNETPEPASSEEDCMAACHIPDPNDYFAAGAKPLPASHVGRTACLACHTTADAPALPATHVGRLDVACQGCHK